MNINEKGVHHMVVRTRRSKKGEHRNIFMFFTRYHRAFSLFFMLISFSFFSFQPFFHLGMAWASWVYK